MNVDIHKKFIPDDSPQISSFESGTRPGASVFGRSVLSTDPAIQPIIATTKNNPVSPIITHAPTLVNFDIFLVFKVERNVINANNATATNGTTKL
ncbi:MAG: hypothetical protein RR483_03170, partial [Clostridia bacterium]